MRTYSGTDRRTTVTRLQLKAEAQVWMEAPIIETLIPIQRGRWKRKLLKKAANSDIAFWLEHNRTRRKIVQQGRVLNIVVTLTSPEELTAANTSFLAKIVHAKRTTFQDGRMDEGPTDQAERYSETFSLTHCSPDHFIQGRFTCLKYDYDMGS